MKVLQHFVSVISIVWGEQLVFFFISNWRGLRTLIFTLVVLKPFILYKPTQLPSLQSEQLHWLLATGELERYRALQPSSVSSLFKFCSCELSTFASRLLSPQESRLSLLPIAECVPFFLYVFLHKREGYGWSKKNEDKTCLGKAILHMFLLSWCHSSFSRERIFLLLPSRQRKPDAAAKEEEGYEDAAVGYDGWRRSRGNNSKRQNRRGRMNFFLFSFLPPRAPAENVSKAEKQISELNCSQASKITLCLQSV